MPKIVFPHRRRANPITTLARRRRLRHAGVAGIGAVIAARRAAKAARTLARRMG
ncbi:hypothetical protein [Erythrobacter rubeus]|uniref:Uncharacterized protein n=1 Tax=Erythrobacter rubeus TaxID=2760803 RepID=A0ABR8KQ92_9SPHN|nr:hypothetical protein [Erythrobacter rubeus]MBD2842933.1 hypothetical protein [Erythrobacter rubeus]